MLVRCLCLTDMCLKVIVNKLEEIICNTNIPQKNVDFLLRVYAGRVYKEYRLIHGTVKEDIMLWFLNPHAKEITLPRELFSEKIVDKLKLTGMGITSLNLHGSCAPENVLNEIVRYVPCVKILDLSRTLCSDSTLSIIQETCTDLESLALEYCENITVNGLENFCCQNQSLKIRGVFNSKQDLYNAGIKLTRMPSPDYDKFVDSPKKRMKIKDEHLKYNISQLTLHNVDSEAIHKLANVCPKIKSLNLESQVLGAMKVLEAYTVFKELEELKLHSDSHILIPFLPISQNLKTLILSGIQMPTVMLIENFKNLKKLCLKDVSFTSFEKEDIKCTENKLNSLVLQNTDIEDFRPTYKAVALLISLSRNVTELSLIYNRNLSNDLFEVILNSMKHLSCVTMYFYTVEMSMYIIPFFNIPSLQTVYTNYSQSDIENFVRLKLSESLSTLSWSYIKAEDYNEHSDEDSQTSADEDSQTSADEDSDEDSQTLMLTL